MQKKRFQGQKDSPLTETGIQQVRAVAKTLRPLLIPGDQWEMFCSPLGRAQQTKRIISSECKLDECHIECTDFLRECDYGSWSGLTAMEVQRTHPDEWSQRLSDKWNYRIPNGESYADLHDRLKKWIGSTDFANNNVLIIAHEMVNRTLRGIILGINPDKTLQFRQSNDAILLIEGDSENVLNAQQGGSSEPHTRPAGL